MGKMKKPKVLVAMSGGVDSSVAALLLKKQGYEVVGAFMVNWSNTKNSYGECSWREEKRTAQKIVAIIGVPLVTLNFEKEYKKFVVDEMFRLYKKGITPNPDVNCNNKIKFPMLIKEAKKLGCDFVATGHYARIKKTGSEFRLLRAKDESKDQSYFLYRLNQKELAKIIFPVGKLKKKKVRKIAEKNGFPNWNKKGTVGICFIGKVNLKKFLQKKIKPKKGDIVNPQGEKIGEHDGIYYYTIGQRIGSRFGIDVKRGFGRQKKWYVAMKNLKKNLIVAAPESHKLNFRKELFVKNLHWINGKSFGKKINARIRHVGELLPCELLKEGKKIKVILKKQITGISEGQAIVFYKGEECLGGGVIWF